MSRCSECANCITSKSDPRVIKGKKQYYCTLKEKGVNDSAGNKCADYVSASLMSGGLTFTESPDQVEVHEPAAPYSPSAAASSTPYASPPPSSAPAAPKQGMFSQKRDCAFCRNCITESKNRKYLKGGKAYWCSYYEKGVNGEDYKNCAQYSTRKDESDPAKSPPIFSSSSSKVNIRLIVGLIAFVYLVIMEIIEFINTGSFFW
ncbi:MAG: hypothetical protein LBS74_07090 [Oscillospiraceae bacterium]|jgi:hypothetical protein|nr:hypothetical protein [Oscillospiraceae bacterium]